MFGERKRFTGVLKNWHRSGNGWKGMGGNPFDLRDGAKSSCSWPGGETLCRTPGLRCSATARSMRRPSRRRHAAVIVAFTDSLKALTAAQSPETLPTFRTGTAARGSLPRLAGVGPKNRQNQPFGA
jgi:hypothetical protein